MSRNERFGWEPRLGSKKLSYWARESDELRARALFERFAMLHTINLDKAQSINWWKTWKFRCDNTLCQSILDLYLKQGLWLKVRESNFIYTNYDKGKTILVYNSLTDSPAGPLVRNYFKLFIFALGTALSCVWDEDTCQESCLIMVTCHVPNEVDDRVDCS